MNVLNVKDRMDGPRRRKQESVQELIQSVSLQRALDSQMLPGATNV